VRMAATLNRRARRKVAVVVKADSNNESTGSSWLAILHIEASRVGDA